MPMEKKKKTPEEIAFNKRWGKLCKLNPDMKSVSKTVGKAPKCGVKVKVEKVAETSSNKKKR